jgi:hypothetical protein
MFLLIAKLCIHGNFKSSRCMPKSTRSNAEKN